jgi:hypothetical protein
LAAGTEATSNIAIRQAAPTAKPIAPQVNRGRIRRTCPTAPSVEERIRPALTGALTTDRRSARANRLSTMSPMASVTGITRKYARRT